MKRLFFLVPDLKMAQTIVDELVKNGVTKKNVHVIGGSAQTLKSAHIPGASFLQTTEVIPTLKRGFIMGVVFCLAIYALFAIVLPPSVKIHGLGIAGIIIFGMGFGFWTSGLITLSMGLRNPIIEKYSSYIEEGHYVMMIDTSPDREQELTNAVVQHHPGAQMATAPNTFH